METRAVLSCRSRHREETAPSGQRPSSQRAPRFRHSFAKEIKDTERPWVCALWSRGNSGHTGREVEARGGARDLRNHLLWVGAGWGRGHPRSDRSGAPEGAMRTACLRREPGTGGELGASGRAGTGASLNLPARPPEQPALPRPR